MQIAIVCASNNDDILKRNLDASPEIHGQKVSRLFYEHGCKNVQAHYNAGLREVYGNDKEYAVVFAHQDVFLPDGFFDALQNQLAVVPKNWGVLGVAGRTPQEYVGHVRDRNNEWGSATGLPREVQTLDELLLILPKDSPLRFDEAIPGAHWYGADICMQAHELALPVLAINAYCYHNSIHSIWPDHTFYKCAEYMKTKWRHRLPIHSTCTVIA